MEPFLRDYQEKAVSQMHNGCVLCGGVGSGKSRTSLAYYFTQNQGKIIGSELNPMKNPKDLYIITTAKKRDTLEWEGELTHYLMSTDVNLNYYKNKIVIDSWNNISKYIDVTNAFFIFDEQRVVGTGAWVKAFHKISQVNQWILLSATPGDTWMDYVPVFIANGFYKNKSEFNREHVIFSRYSKFPKVDRYFNEKRLYRLRDSILVDMEFARETISHHMDVYCDYNNTIYKDITKSRWDIWKNEPIKNAAELCYLLRKVVNSDETRAIEIQRIFSEHPKVIIFYNFDYELDILKSINYGKEVEVAECNGHKHQPVPTCNSWVYLVQYNSGAEGWNCIRTDTIIFFSQNYSYKIMAQASGRIDRMNTPFKDLYYFHLKSHSGIDVAISKAITNKKKFNESKFADFAKGD